MTVTALRNLHVPIPDHIHSRLKQHSKSIGLPATALVREAIERWLDERDRQQLDDAIAAYAMQTAGSQDDLDPVVEEAGLEALAALDEERS